MDDSVILAVAIGSSALGLLLFAVAGVVAIYLNTGARGSRDVASADKSQSRTHSPNVQPATARSPFAWIKAWRIK